MPLGMVSSVDLNLPDAHPQALPVLGYLGRFPEQQLAPRGQVIPNDWRIEGQMVLLVKNTEAFLQILRALDFARVKDLLLRYQEKHHFQAQHYLGYFREWGAELVVRQAAVPLRLDSALCRVIGFY